MERTNPVSGQSIKNLVDTTQARIREKTIKVKFSKELQDQIDTGLKLSKHARERISSRDLNISDKELESIGEAVQKADTKGIKDSLIMFKDTALIVSVRNKTIITAMKKDSLKDNVITNVDGVIMM